MKQMFEAYFGVKLGNNKTQKIKCAWHSPDDDPSLALNIEDGTYRCYSCGKFGHVKDLMPQYRIIQESEVDRLHQCLLVEVKLQQWLYETKGITVDTIKNLKIGHNGSRFAFPVRDFDNNCINLRLYSSTNSPKCISYGEGFGAPAFFPFPPREDKIYLMEGETDTVVARQLGLPAYCETAGAGTWTDELTRMLAGKEVTVIYDTDSPGRRGAGKLINAIKFTCGRIKNILLPLPIGMKDFSDWVLKSGGNKKLLEDLETQCPDYMVSKQSSIIVDNPTKVHLSDTARADLAFKSVETEVTVAGKDRAPYMIPKTVGVECSANLKICAMCPNSKGQGTYLVEWKDASIVQFIDINEELKLLRIKRIIEIPPRCHCFIEVLEYQNIERLALYPKVDWQVDDESDGEVTLKRGYFMGTGIQSNTSYIFRGIPVPDSRDQSCSLLIVEAEPIQKGCNDEVDPKLLEIFRVKERDYADDKEQDRDLRSDAHGEGV